MAKEEKEKRTPVANLTSIIRKTQKDGVTFLDDSEVSALLKSDAAKSKGVSIDATRLRQDDWLGNQDVIVPAVLIGFDSFQDETGKTVLGVLFYSDFMGKNELYQCSLSGLTTKLRGKKKGLYTFKCTGVSERGQVEFSVIEKQAFN